MSPVSPRIILSRMEAACRETSRHLDLIHRQIAGRAERVTVTEKAKSHNRSHKRSGWRWSRSDEMLYQAHLDRLAFERRVELDGLARKLARQELAIDLLRRKLDETAARRKAACGCVGFLSCQEGAGHPLVGASFGSARS